MEWNKQRDEIKGKEITVSFCSVLIILYAIISEYYASKGIKFLKLTPEFSLALLQIQTAISMITLTVIAFLTGNISDSYKGISISRFYLEQRPVFFKQKGIVVFEFLALGFSIWSYLYGLCYILLGVFIVSGIFVLVSILQVYSIFNGKRDIENEINSYLKYLIETLHDYSNVPNYIADWKALILSQSTEEFNQYQSTFINIIRGILLHEKKVNMVNSYTESIARYLLQHDSKLCKARGVFFIIDYYKHISRWINSDEIPTKEIQGQISLIAILWQDWLYALQTVEIEKVEEKLYFSIFSYQVIEVALCIGQPSSEVSYEIVAVEKLSKRLGSYLNKQIDMGNNFNTEKWTIIFSDAKYDYPFSEKLPYINIPEFKKSLVVRDFSIFYGYLISGQIDLLKESIFVNGINRIDNPISEEQALLVMLIHCYMYYYAFRESTDYVSRKNQKKVRKILRDKEIMKQITSFYKNSHVYNNDIIKEDTYKKMSGILAEFEVMPKNGRMKRCIIDKVTELYFLYIALLVYPFAKKTTFLSDVLKLDKYEIYLYEGQDKYLKEQLFQISSIIYFESEEKMDSEVDRMVSDFYSYMAAMYKEKIIKEARMNQRYFDKEKLAAKIENSIQKEYTVKFNNLFQTLTIDSPHDEYTVEKKFCFGPYYTQQMMDREFEIDVFRNLVGDYIKTLIHDLRVNLGIKEIDKENLFVDDEEFRIFLQENNYVVMIGSNYIFDNNLFMANDGLLDNQKFICVAAGGIGLACKSKSIKIKLEELNVKISSPSSTDKERCVAFREGKYIAKNGIVLRDFSEEELFNLLQDEYKMVHITIKAEIFYKSDDEEKPFLIIK